MIKEISEELNGKKILILGFGREGKSTYNFVTKNVNYSSLGIADLNEIKKEDLEGNEKVEIYTGKDYLQTMYDYDVIIQTPGIALQDKFGEDIISKITSQTELFLKYAEGRVIGITGTKGKSTTASLTYEMLKNAGLNVRLGGNIGLPSFEMLDDEDSVEYFVYELSGHQLEHVKHSPHISVMLNIYEEHLDHFGSYEKYKEAKSHIHIYQKSEDYYIYNFDIREELFDESNYNQNKIGVSLTEHLQKEGEELDNMTIVENYKICSVVDGKKLEIEFPVNETKLQGLHNIYNAMVAITICNILGINAEIILETLKNFEPLPHRLQNIGTYNGVKYVDDSISTIPEATIKAIETIQNVGSVLIGGMDREIDYAKLIDYIKNTTVKNIILMYDTGKRIYENIKDDKNHNIVYFETLEEAVKYAVENTVKNKVCLLSPAAASYGAFKNFEHRGEMFKEYILKYSV